MLKGCKVEMLLKFAMVELMRSYFIQRQSLTLQHYNLSTSQHLQLYNFSTLQQNILPRFLPEPFEQNFYV